MDRKTMLAGMAPAIEFFSYAQERERGHGGPTEEAKKTEEKLLRRAIGDLDFNAEIFILSEQIEGEKNAVTEPEGWAKR